MSARSACAIKKEVRKEMLRRNQRDIAALTVVLIIAVSAGAAVAAPVVVGVIEVGPGEPEIVEVSDITIEGGGQATLIAKVKNIGYTEDTLIPSLGLPDGMIVISYPGDRSVAVDQTIEFKWILAVGNVESARTESATLRVVAKNSLLEDSITFPVHLEPNPPIIRTGDFTVHVFDAETDLPLAGAEVTCAGVKVVTGVDGLATFNDIGEGDQALTVELEGYPRYSEVIHIREGTNFRTVRLSETSPPPAKPWPMAPLVLALVVVITAVGGVILIGKKKGWWLR